MSNRDHPMFRAYVPDVPGVSDLERIGRGGFARVYRGWQAEMRRLVAVKVLDGVIDDPDSERRFRREVAAMGATSHHPNVVPVYVTGVTSDGHPFLVMPFLPGGTLGDRLRKERLRADEAVLIGAKVADALAAAHATGVLHRDVKPSNILFSAYGEPQLADFGIARLADATRTTSGSVAATIAYAAPEILTGEHAGPASDVYSLGASLHAALTGTPPFIVPPGEPLAASVARAAVQRPADLRVLGVPDALAGVIERAMSKDPAGRPPTADALRRQLEAAGAGGGLGSEPTLAFDPVPTSSTGPTPVGQASRPPSESPVPLGPSAHLATLDGAEPVPPNPARSRSGRGPALLVGALALVVVAALGFLLVRALGGDGSSRTSGRTPASSEPSRSTPTTAGGAAAQPTTGASGGGRSNANDRSGPSSSTSGRTSTTSRPSSSTSQAPSTAAAASGGAAPGAAAPAPTNGAPGAATPDATVNEYYRLVGSGSLQTGFQWLTSRYQAEAGGFRTYQSFWQSIRSVQVLGVVPRGDSTADATLRYEMANGAVSVERVELRFSRSGATGNLLIDGYRVL